MNILDSFKLLSNDGLSQGRMNDIGADRVGKNTSEENSQQRDHEWQTGLITSASFIIVAGMAIFDVACYCISH